MIFLNVLLWIFLIFLLLLAAVVFLPICYRVEGKFGPRNEVSAVVSWMFLFRILYEYSPEDSVFVVKAGPYKVPASLLSFPAMGKKEEEKDDESSFKFSDIKTLLTNLDIKSIIPLGIILMKKLCKKILPRHLHVRGVIGLSDPFSTVQFISFYEAISGAANLRSAIDICGDFSQKRLEMDLKMSGRFAVVSLLWPVLWFILQKPVRKGFLSQRNLQRRKKKGRKINEQ